MNPKHKIPAFTLSEMIVVLMITSIVVGMAFSVLSLVQRHMNSIKNNFSTNTELNRFEQSLWIDFNRYGTIKYYKLNDALVCSSEIDSVIYKFTDKLIVKDIDTFYIPIQNKTVYFDGDKKDTGLIDAIQLKTTKALQSQTLFIYKQNDAAQFINSWPFN